MVRILFVYLLLLIGLQVAAQSQDKVQLLNANSLVFDLQATGKVKRLIGDVRFKQSGTLLFCDSAYQYDEINRVEAFGNVRIIHHDSIFLYGDQLNYEGNTKHATLKGNAKMVDRDMTITSPSLDYDMQSNYGYYVNGGKIVNGKNVLTSKSGYYFANTKENFFKNNVVLNHPDYNIYTDTLKYNTRTRVAYFFGPTRIISYNDRLFCKSGQYDTEKQIAMFGKNSVVASKSNILAADSIYYEKLNQFGKAYNNIEIFDTVNKIIVYGDYAEMRGKSNEFYVTKKAVAKQYMQNDSMFVFADTIFSYQSKDKTKQLVRAYAHVKLLKSDMQAICDSLLYDRTDSCITLYKKPVMWSGSNQITSDTIELFLVNNQLDSFVLRGNAFLISREAAKLYNQIKGKNMYGFFEDNAIRYMHVNGNGQSIYYVKEDSDFVGVNEIDCSEMDFNFIGNKIASCNFINKPVSVFHPMINLKPEQLRLKGFVWLNNLRPTPVLIMKHFYRKSIFFKKNLIPALIYQ